MEKETLRSRIGRDNVRHSEQTEEQERVVLHAWDAASLRTWCKISGGKRCTGACIMTLNNISQTVVSSQFAIPYLFGIHTQNKAGRYVVHGSP